MASMPAGTMPTCLRRIARAPVACPAVAAAAREQLPSFFLAKSHHGHHGHHRQRHRFSSATDRGGAAAAATTAAPLDIDAFLSPFKNHERTGIPKGAGTAQGTDGFDMTRMRRLLKALSDPHLGYPVIHVAGTKGKGSTVGFLAAVLRAAGYNTGTYKSPHVHSVAERIVCGPVHVEGTRVGGDTAGNTAGDAATAAAASLVTDAAVDADTADAILRTQAAEGGALTYFEVLTALAFLRFKRLNVQRAVVEVGVGGELDATNVFPPESLAAAVITAIGEDHWDALGGSLSHIVRAKCGIIRPHRPVFLVGSRSQKTKQAE